MSDVRIRNTQEHPITVTAYKREGERVIPAYHTFPPGESSISLEGFQLFASDIHFKPECGHLSCMTPLAPRSKNARTPEEIQVALKRLHAEQARSAMSNELKSETEQLSAQAAKAAKAAEDAEARAEEAERRAAAAEERAVGVEAAQDEVEAALKAAEEAEARAAEAEKRAQEAEARAAKAEAKPKAKSNSKAAKEQ